VRVLFAFDRVRRAILLVGGDKSDDWSGWYDTKIPIADARFDEHQATVEKAESKRVMRGKVGRRDKER
jgi:hypothetical protein